MSRLRNTCEGAVNLATYEVTSGLSNIDFGATGHAEILQNIKMIMATPEFSCPLKRDFAWSPEVDAPINVAKTKIIARLTEAIKTYEPRAQIISVRFLEDGALDGRLRPIVKISIP